MSLVVPISEIFQDETGLLSKYDSWERVELGEVCEILNGYAFKSTRFNKTKGVPIIRIRDLAKNSTETLYDGGYPPEYIVENGDLLVGMDGNFGCYRWKGGQALLNQRVCKLIPREEFLLQKFLLFSINGYLKAIQDATSSVTVGHLSSRDMQKIPLPFPPLNEQKRIVEKLEKLFGKVEAAQERLDKIPTILKRFRQSVLAAACSGKLTADWRTSKNALQDLPEDWNRSSLGALISDGPQNGLYKPQSAYGEGSPIVRIDSFYDGSIVKQETLKRLVLTEPEKGAYAIAMGDILISRVNSMPYLGKSALVRKLKELTVFESNMMKITPNADIIDPEYLIRYLNSIEGLAELRKNAKHAVNQSSINQQDVKGVELNVPPLKEQKEIVRRVEEFFKFADQIEERYKKARSYTDKLTQSILAKAFRGELVPQDPNDEPASVLLERIRANREAKMLRNGRKKKG